MRRVEAVPVMSAEPAAPDAELAKLLEEQATFLKSGKAAAAKVIRVSSRADAGNLDKPPVLEPAEPAGAPAPPRSRFSRHINISEAASEQHASPPVPMVMEERGTKGLWRSVSLGSLGSSARHILYPRCQELPHISHVSPNTQTRAREPPPAFLSVAPPPDKQCSRVSHTKMKP